MGRESDGRFWSLATTLLRRASSEFAMVCVRENGDSESLTFGKPIPDKLSEGSVENTRDGG